MAQHQSRGADARRTRARHGRSATYRLLHLSFVLLSARRPLTRAQIFDRVEEYRDTPESSRNRTFERDKALLRANGFALEVVRVGDDYSGLEEDGYRIVHSGAQLPSITFSPEEQQLLTAAQGAWRGTALSQVTGMGVAKLLHDTGHEGAEAPAPVLGGLQLALAGEVDAAILEALTEAQRDARAVQFDYRSWRAGAGSRTPTRRTVEVWALGQRKGFWYLVGRDVDRGERRTFKLNRIVGVPVPHGRSGVVRRPDDLDVAAVLAGLGPSPDEPTTATVAIRGEFAPHLRRGADPVDPQPEQVLPEGYRAYRVQVADTAAFLGQVAMSGPDVIVLEPESLRTAIVAHLRGILEDGSSSATVGGPDAHQ